MNEQIMKEVGFSEEVNRIKKGQCPFCKKEIYTDEFRDEVSWKEYQISGLCQVCQDKMFGE